MASIRDIKRRKTSIQNTQQITKAMKLVSTAKFQKAKINAEETRAYFSKMYDTVTSILSKTEAINHPFLVKNESNKKGYIVITSNRGLAGGYNANIIKLIANKERNPEEVLTYAVGRKGKDGLKRRGFKIEKDLSYMIDNPIYNDAVKIGKVVLDAYFEHKISEIYLVYTDFKTTLTQESKILKLLPINKLELEGDKKGALMNYEPSEEEVLNSMIPRYIYSLIYGALRESIASEQGARMTAMDSATKNAGEMIEGLTLEFNRARQASITQEISEIVGGAEALK
ncbi:MAG: ATP synthase F1 subunit gamma [Eubacteriales bacterium]